MKSVLIFVTEAFVCKYRGQTVSVVFDKVCTDCNMDFVPLLHTDLLNICQVLALPLDLVLKTC